MTNSKLMTSMQRTTQRNTESGNTVIVGLIVLVLVAVGAIAYMSGQLDMGTDKSSTQTASSEPASGEDKADKKIADAKQGEGQTVSPDIKPGNPVVAKIAGKDVTRVDVLNYMQTLPPQTRQAVPPEQLFPLAQNQIVNERLVAEKVSKVDLDNDPLVKEQLALAKKQIVRQVFIEKEIQKGMTDERLKAAYDIYLKNFPEVEEVKTRHILVKEEGLAKDIIKQLKGGGDFAALAKEHSIDATKENGGELGYISRDDQVLPQYIEAAFTQKKDEVSKKPISSDFGFHIVEVLETRMRPPAEFEKAKAYLASQIRNQVLNDLVQGWRNEANIEILDINGEPIEPAAGE